MDYSKQYARLIENAKCRTRPTGYVETHHIMPRSMGGSDDHENLVVLTAREHFLAHWLLWLIYQNRSTGVAWVRMTRRGRTDHGFYSRNYERARKAWSACMSGGEHPSARAVKNLDTGEVFPTARAGAFSIGLTSAAVSSAIKAKCRAGGFRWTHVENCAEELQFFDRGFDKKKPIQCQQTGERFDSATDAGLEFRIPARTIANATRSGFRAGGVHWFRIGEPKPVFKEKKDVQVRCVQSGEVFVRPEDAAQRLGMHVTSIQNSAKTGRACKGLNFEWVEPRVR